MPTEKERISGLILRGKTWWIDKKVSGKRICESCRTSDYQEAVKYFCFRVDQLRQAEIYGVRPKRIWREAAIKYLNEAEKSSIRCDALQLKMLDGFIGDLPLDSIHMGSLQGFLEWRKSQGRKKRTINYALQVVRHILNLCAGEWMDEHGMTWLQSAPKIKLFRENDKRPPYPISWDEQMALFSGVTTLSSQDGPICGQHRLSRTGDLRAEMGLGNRGAGTQYECFYSSRRISQK